MADKSIEDDLKDRQVFKVFLCFDTNIPRVYLILHMLFREIMTHILMSTIFTQSDDNFWSRIRVRENPREMCEE